MNYTTVKTQDYPRVGGGTFAKGDINHANLGLSPRGRGNHGNRDRETEGTGTIPAWAGEPLLALLVAGLTGDYPRVGGGTVPLPG